MTPRIHLRSLRFSTDPCLYAIETNYYRYRDLANYVSVCDVATSSSSRTYTTYLDKVGGEFATQKSFAYPVARQLATNLHLNKQPETQSRFNEDRCQTRKDASKIRWLRCASTLRRSFVQFRYTNLQSGGSTARLYPFRE